MECPLCYNISSKKSFGTHILRKCSKFQNYKENLTKENYIGTKLNPIDSIGFCSAGIIPWSTNSQGQIKLLGLYETRDNEIKINFVGGGREGHIRRFDCKVQTARMETAKQTGFSEFSEEMSQLIDPKLLDPVRQYIIRQLNRNKYKVMWVGSSKMVYYLIRIPDYMSNEMPGKIDSDKLTQSYCKTIGFDWFELDQLSNTNTDVNTGNNTDDKTSSKPNQVHNFTKPIIKFIESNKNNLFV